MPSVRRHQSVFVAWLPLALMWILMAVEQPTIAAVVARLPEAKRQLAAFGVTFSLALFIEGPIIQMLAAATAVADTRENYMRLMGMMHVIGWSATAIHALLCLPWVFQRFALGVLGIPSELIEPARWALLSMLPWTTGVGYRRLWQGVLIRHGRTKVIPITMVIRMVVSFGTLAWGYSTGRLQGAVLGGLALSLGVIAGAIAAWFYARPVIRNLPSHDWSSPSEETSSVMTWTALALFYIPLALTNFINLGARPVMQMGLARGPLPLESLALWPVSMGYLFLYTSFSLSSQEVVIARLNGAESRKELLRFIVGLAVVLTTVYGLAAATPLWRLWFSKLSGLDADLTDMALKPVLLGLPVIPFSALISLYRGALVSQRRTKEVTLGVTVNIVILLGALFVGVAILPVPAIQTVSGAFSLAFIGEFVFLAFRKPLREYRHGI